MSQEIPQKKKKKPQKIAKKIALGFVVLSSVPLLAMLCAIVLSELGPIGGADDSAQIEAKIAKEVQERVAALSPSADMPALSKVKTPPLQLADSHGRFSVSDYLRLARERNISLDRLHDLKYRIVALDAGHGGRDDGVVYAKNTEKDLMLDLSKRVQDTLTMSYGINAVLTRNSDDDLAIGDRLHRAAELEADLMVSLHISKSKDNDKFSMRSYYFGASDQPNILKSISILNQGGELSMREFSLAIDTYIGSLVAKESRALAQQIHSAVSAVVGKFDAVTTQDYGVAPAPLTQLLAADVPAMMFEFGALKNYSQQQFWRSEDNRQLLAEAIAKGIASYILMATHS